MSPASDKARSCFKANKQQERSLLEVFWGLKQMKNCVNDVNTFQIFMRK